MKPINLLLCGSFNPITKQHLELFKTAKDYLKTININVNQMILSPVSKGYNKETLKLISPEDRLVMICYALANWNSNKNNLNYQIKLDLWEFQQDDWTPTIKVLEYNRDKYCQSEDLYLLCGADLLKSFNTPGVWSEKDQESIIDSYGLVCHQRDQINIKDEIDQNIILKSYRENIYLIKQNEVNISSTMVRELAKIKKWKILGDYLDKSIIDYIKNNKLYQEL